MMKTFGLAMVIVTSQGTWTLEDSRATIQVHYPGGYFETLSLVKRGRLDPQELVPDRCSFFVRGSGVSPRVSSKTISIVLRFEMPCSTIVDTLGTPVDLSNSVPFWKFPGPNPNDKFENHGLFGLTVLPADASDFEREMSTYESSVGQATTQVVTISSSRSGNSVAWWRSSPSMKPLILRLPAENLIVINGEFSHSLGR